MENYSKTDETFYDCKFWLYFSRETSSSNTSWRIKVSIFKRIKASSKWKFDLIVCKERVEVGVFLCWDFPHRYFSIFTSIQSCSKPRTKYKNLFKKLPISIGPCSSSNSHSINFLFFINQKIIVVVQLLIFVIKLNFALHSW